MSRCVWTPGTFALARPQGELRTALRAPTKGHTAWERLWFSAALPATRRWYRALKHSECIINEHYCLKRIWFCVICSVGPMRYGVAVKPELRRDPMLEVCIHFIKQKLRVLPCQAVAGLQCRSEHWREILDAVGRDKNAFNLRNQCRDA